jgi:hypothetical protein
MLDNCLPRRRNGAFLLGALAVALLAAASPASACDARLGTLQADAIAYDPFSSAGVEGSVRLQVELTEGDTCDVVVSLTDESGAQLRSLRFGNDEGVTFRLELRQQGIVGSATDPADAIVHLTSAAPRAQVEWRLLTIGDAVIAPGDYAKQIEARLRVSEGVPGPPSRGAVVLRSIARAQANLAGTAGKFASGSDAATIDLGELVTGKSGRAYLQVRANTPAHVSFRSANLGWLVNDRAPGARVRYAMTLAGRPVDLAATTVTTVDAPRSVDGDAFSIDVTVGDVGGASAGRYSDTVTIDVSP